MNPDLNVFITKKILDARKKLAKINLSGKFLRLAFVINYLLK